MGKISLNATLVSNFEKLNTKVIGIKSNNKITYKENNITVTILICDNRIEMNRVCNDYKIKLIFEKGKNTISKYEDTSLNKIYDLNTNTANIEIDKKRINIKYSLEGNDFSYSLNMEDL